MAQELTPGKKLAKLLRRLSKAERARYKELLDRCILALTISEKIETVHLVMLESVYPKCCKACSTGTHFQARDPYQPAPRRKEYRQLSGAELAERIKALKAKDAARREIEELNDFLNTDPCPLAASPEAVCAVGVCPDMSEVEISA